MLTSKFTESASIYKKAIEAYMSEKITADCYVYFSEDDMYITATQKPIFMSLVIHNVQDYILWGITAEAIAEKAISKYREIVNRRYFKKGNRK